MGLIEQTRYLLSLDVEAVAAASVHDPADALRLHILAIEAGRLQLDQALLRLRQVEADLARRRRYNASKVAQREREKGD